MFVNHLNRGYGIHTANMSIWDEWQVHKKKEPKKSNVQNSLKILV